MAPEALQALVNVRFWMEKAERNPSSRKFETAWIMERFSGRGRPEGSAPTMTVPISTNAEMRAKYRSSTRRGISIRRNPAGMNGLWPEGSAAGWERTVWKTAIIKGRFLFWKTEWRIPMPLPGIRFSGFIPSAAVSA